MTLDATTYLDQLLPRLGAMAAGALVLWDIPADAKLRLINVSENVTYLVEGPGGWKAVLRVHRPDYHSHRAIECELAWMDALNNAGVAPTPRYLPGRNGDPIQTAGEGDLNRSMVLFDFIEGHAPDESGDLTPGFRELGAIAARCHDHAMTWNWPADFQRLTWDEDAVFGSQPLWGDWRDAPGVDSDVRAVLEQAQRVVSARLAAYGKAPGRYNLIHADMRLANLLVGAGETRLIDFDDCGFGWLTYDFAAAISFIEDDPRIPALKAAWLGGYRSVRPLTAEDEAEIETMVMLRRFALLAWIGSHIEAPEPQALAPDFAARTAVLAKVYLEAHEG